MTTAPPPDHPLLDTYAHALVGKSDRTIELYHRVLRHLFAWLADRPDTDGPFVLAHLTRTAVETHLSHLQRRGYSLSHRTRIKAVIRGFAAWLIAEHAPALRNPTRGIILPPAPVLAPRQLTNDQRYVLRTLVERARDPRGEVLFALGYWAGCRASDVAWLCMEDTHLTARTGWIQVGIKNHKTREIDLCRSARYPLQAYLEDTAPGDRLYVFPSQRGERLTETGLHHWFRTLKSRASKPTWDLIHDVTFHDLRNDFAHRARAAGWTLEELAYYPVHITRKGTPAIQTTARYTQVSRPQLQTRLDQLDAEML